MSEIKKKVTEDVQQKEEKERNVLESLILLIVPLRLRFSRVCFPYFFAGAAAAPPAALAASLAACLALIISASLKSRTMVEARKG
jgi:hypothetical protein